MKAAVVILNYNTRDYLRDFLPALKVSCAGLDAEILVADNGSTDGSVEMLREEFPDVRLIRFAANLGFTGGYNKALSELLDGPDTPECVVLLNSDVLVTENWLSALLDFMDANPDCAICGPKLHRLDRNADGSYAPSEFFEYAGAAGGMLDRYGYPYCRGRVLRRIEADRGQYDASRPEVLWVSGACLMIRSAVWKCLGGFDRRFFAHMEEIDLCWRAQLEGMRVCVVCCAAVYHLGGGTLSYDSPRKVMLNHRNSLLLLHKNLPATIGQGAARRRIALRSILDFISGAAYLLSGQKESFKALRRARREAAALRLEDSGNPPVSGGGKVRGYTGLFIVLRYFCLRGRIFEYLRKYENSN